jgi:hypothetical protein
MGYNIYNLNIYKFHSETSCIAISNKQSMSFFKGEQEGKIGPVWGLILAGGRRL